MDLKDQNQHSTVSSQIVSSNQANIIPSDVSKKSIFLLILIYSAIELFTLFVPGYFVILATGVFFIDVVISEEMSIGLFYVFSFMLFFIALLFLSSVVLSFVYIFINRSRLSKNVPNKLHKLIIISIIILLTLLVSFISVGFFTFGFV